MTIPTERTRAVQLARNFLRQLLDRKETPRVPAAVREAAHRVLRHFPSDFDLHVAAQAQPATWGNPEPAEALGLPAEAPEAYLLKLTPEQAQVLVHACDLYSRIGIGQFEEIEQLARMGMLRHRHATADGAPAVTEAEINRLEQAREALDVAKRHLTGMEPNASFGILNQLVHKDFKVAWELQQVVRHRLAWDARGNPARRDWAGSPSMMGVNYDDPMASSGTPLATMEQASDADLLEALPTGYALSRSNYGSDQKWHLFSQASSAGAGKAAAGAPLLNWLGSGESVRSMLALAQDTAARK
jgi:hypothetical protein